MLFASISSDTPNTSVLHRCHDWPDCSDELPDPLPVLRWEGAKVLFAELLDSFPANILSVAGLFEYPGKSSASCRLARRVPQKHFYRNCWQRRCLVWRSLSRGRQGEQRFKHHLCVSGVRSLAPLLLLTVHALGTGCRNSHLHPEYVSKCSWGQEKAGVHGAEHTHSGTSAVSLPRVTY